MNIIKTFARTSLFTLKMGILLIGILTMKPLLISLFFILMLNSYVNKFLKQLFKKYICINDMLPFLGSCNRPDDTEFCGIFNFDSNSNSNSNSNYKNKNGYGMPSGHAQFIGVVTVYLILYVLDNFDIKELKTKLLILFLIGLSILICYSRVYWTKCHTIMQVIVGWLIGAIIGYIFYIKLKM
jgi:membrane-associated phospholipid phosphatase